MAVDADPCLECYIWFVCRLYRDERLLALGLASVLTIFLSEKDVKPILQATGEELEYLALP
jgi:hypothetical protein